MDEERVERNRIKRDIDGTLYGAQKSKACTSLTHSRLQ